MRSVFSGWVLAAWLAGAGPGVPQGVAPGDDGVGQTPRLEWLSVLPAGGQDVSLDEVLQDTGHVGASVRLGVPDAREGEPVAAGTAPDGHPSQATYRVAPKQGPPA